MATTVEARIDPVRIVVINAGVSDPSSTRMLAERIAQRSLERLSEAKVAAALAIIDLAPLAVDIAKAVVAGFPGERLQAAIDTLAHADAAIAATPVYKAGMSGLFKSFIDLLDNDLLIAKPVVLAATGGSARHAIVPDEQMRPLFGYMRAIPVPTSIFASPEDWSDPALTARIDRVAVELSVFVTKDVGSAIVNAGWSAYQHQFGGNALRADQAADGVDFDTDLMRLATGGSLSPA